MVVIICLLLYFNLYYEHCFTDALIEISKIPMFSFLKFLIKTEPTNNNNRHIYTETSKEIIEI